MIYTYLGTKGKKDEIIILIPGSSVPSGQSQ